jgi:hypothetical protein
MSRTPVADITDEGLSPLDRARAATMADEGGAAAAFMEAGPYEGGSREWGLVPAALAAAAGAALAYCAYRMLVDPPSRRLFSPRGR